MHVRVSDVKKWVGREELAHLTEDWPESCRDRMEYPLESPAQVNVLVRNTGQSLVVEISGEAVCQASCSRCLEPFTLQLSFSAIEQFKEEPGPQDPVLDYYRYTGDKIFLDELVSDAVGLSVPIAPVCREDCLGLCSTCGANRNERSCDCEEPVDSRWESLRRLLDQTRGE